MRWDNVRLPLATKELQQAQAAAKEIRDGLIAGDPIAANPLADARKLPSRSGKPPLVAA
jgi:hypothetical protein